MPSELLHVVGYVTGAALYAMLLMTAARDRAGDRLSLGTGVLGLGWNVGEIGVQALRVTGARTAEGWVAAGSFTSLGFLAAVVVHSVWRGALADGAPAARLARPLTGVAYLCAAVAGGLHIAAAAGGNRVPAPAALLLMTTGVLALSPVLLVATRRQAHSRRATWMTALAVFSVSALHIGSFHGTRESWISELLGHHASIPVAFAILYQHYRFALADLFLKQALMLLAGVSMIFIAWSIAGPAVIANPGARAVGLLLVLWMASLLVFPWIRARVARFVDTSILGRANYALLLDELVALTEQCGTAGEALDRTCHALAPALSATSVRWVVRQTGSTDRLEHPDILVHTAEAPHYVLTVGRLADGRRLLSDDLAMLERVAFILGRRIDAIRLGSERYERMLREHEMRSLATESELRALRAQINPHFLFNTLTTIGYLIQAAPPRALDTLMRLTTILRSVLRSDGEFTTLGRERELIGSYLQIEQERFEERLRVRIDIPEHLWHFPIPGLIVQPLVENAVKHGIATARNGGHIRVRAAIDATRREMRLIVSNTGSPFVGRRPSHEGGIGLRNVERRLEAHYGDRAWLKVRAGSDGETIAEVCLPVTAVGEEDMTAISKRRAG